jgi:hypothetical protein
MTIEVKCDVCKKRIYGYKNFFTSLHFCSTKCKLEYYKKNPPQDMNGNLNTDFIKYLEEKLKEEQK